MDNDQDRMELVADFLRQIMRDENEDTKDRLKASELLAKAPAYKTQSPDAIEIRVIYGDGQ